MRTTRLLPVSPSMHCSRGYTCQGGGTCLGVVPAQGGFTCPGGVPAWGVTTWGRCTCLGAVPAWWCTCPWGVPAWGSRTCLGVYLWGGIPVRGVYLPMGGTPPPLYDERYCSHCETKTDGDHCICARSAMWPTTALRNARLVGYIKMYFSISAEFVPPACQPHLFLWPPLDVSTSGVVPISPVMTTRCQ